MIRVLSFGAGVQTTALAILVIQGKLKVDVVVFADTGVEKPETYWYMESYTKPEFEKAHVPFEVIRNDRPGYEATLYDYYWSRRDLPSVQWRRCTDHYKLRPMKRRYRKDVHMLIGFSIDEIERTNRPRTLWATESYPLIEMGLSASDCHFIINDFGWPIPLKSSCYICPFQPVIEWNWLKMNQPALFLKALALEEHYYERRPTKRNEFGLLRGTPLWKLRQGVQPEMLIPGEYSCWSGACGH